MSFTVRAGTSLILVQKNCFILLGFGCDLNMLAWYGHLIPNETLINNLVQVQRRATRFILGRDYSEHERLSKLNLLPLQYRRELNDLVNFFMCFKNIYKLNIFDYVSFRS